MGIQLKWSVHKSRLGEEVKGQKKEGKEEGKEEGKTDGS
jgi:hypothetical protein